jgi:DNA-binding transcriptional LysR family regulator
MDFDQLVTFVEVAKLSSFSKAARKLFRSQPAVSAQIQQLEHECGARLFDRTTKSVSLTDAGRVFFECAERLMLTRQEGLRAIAEQGDNPQGVLAIGANEATCLYVLPGVFAKYSALYPSVSISIYRNFTRKIVERLEDGSLDVGIVTMPMESPKLTTRPIFRDRLMLMVHSGSPLAKMKSVPVEIAAKEKFIYPKTGYTRQVLEKIFKPYASLQIRMELPSVEMIKSFVAAGMGVSILSESFAAGEARANKIKLLPLEGVDIYRELGLAYAEKSLSRSAKAFVEMIESGTGLDRKLPGVRRAREAANGS